MRDQYELRVIDDEDGKTNDVVVSIMTDRQSAFDRVLAAGILRLPGGLTIPTISLGITLSQPRIRGNGGHPVKFVVRGYSTGSTSTSLWQNYREDS